MAVSREYAKDDEVIYQRTTSLDLSSLQRPPSQLTIREQFSERCQRAPHERELSPETQSSNTVSECLESKSDPITLNEGEKENTDTEFSSSCIECVKPYRVLGRGDLAKGDHIIHAGAVYDHHAIVVEIEPDERDEDNDKKARVVLIHATNNTKRVTTGCTKIFGDKAKIRQTDEYFDFEKCTIMVVKYFNAPFDTTEIIQRAEEELQKQDFKYHLFGNNCEHFATFCVTNERFSVQVRKFWMTFRMFLSGRFVSLSDEKQRNEVAHGRQLICKLCFERNTKLLKAEKKPVKEKSDVNEGDIITFKYWHLHHDAIVLQVHEDEAGRKNGVDLTFAHYAFCGPFKHRTIKEERKIFPLNGSVTVTMYESPQYTVYSPEESIERARSRVGEKQFALYSNDSSHFARWCKLKLSHSC